MNYEIQIGSEKR